MHGSALGANRWPFAIEEGKGLGKYGRNPIVGATFETVWTAGGDYPWPAAAATSRIRSTDAADTMDVQVFGELEDWSPVLITATLDGTNWVTLPVDLYRSFRARPRGLIEPQGNIEVEIGEVKTLEVLVGRNSTEMALFTVPKGNVLWIPAFLGTNDGVKGGSFKIWVREPGNLFYNDGHMYISAEKGTHCCLFEPHRRYAEGYDIEIRGTSTVAGQVSAGFGGLFKNYLRYTEYSV